VAFCAVEARRRAHLVHLGEQLVGARGCQPFVGQRQPARGHPQSLCSQHALAAGELPEDLGELQTGALPQPQQVAQLVPDRGVLQQPGRPRRQAPAEVDQSDRPTARAAPRLALREVRPEQRLLARRQPAGEEPVDRAAELRAVDGAGTVSVDVPEEVRWPQPTDMQQVSQTPPRAVRRGRGAERRREVRGAEHAVPVTVCPAEDLLPLPRRQPQGSDLAMGRKVIKCRSQSRRA
jgi:hypothetical protein